MDNETYWENLLKELFPEEKDDKRLSAAKYGNGQPIMGIAPLPAGTIKEKDRTIYTYEMFLYKMQGYDKYNGRYAGPRSVVEQHDRELRDRGIEVPKRQQP